MTSKDKDFVTRFIHIYRKNPCLWDQKRRDYTNKEERNKGYESLIRFSKRVYPNANKDWVTKKIECLRATCRREHKKVMWQRSCGGPEYKPTLWYYNLLQFLYCDDSEQLQPTEGDEGEDEQEGYEPEESEDYNVVIIAQQNGEEYDTLTPSQRQSLKRSKGNESLEKDECDALAVSWASKLRKVDPIQRILAEDLISSILTRAFFGELTRETCLSESS